ncbi:hypothetical protein CYMTET_20158 [Cymbomonas tetramitiformis]|uniref:cGMP-dependent protein kinase n=1 Tax=Cymbomonas tetramitiformis TaxID=36881 RepID=A0AAE0G4N5_9CHLO|nr:hypothetical protein CYMTET_20158 [Cymbomonas tetramitiformis]
MGTGSPQVLWRRVAALRCKQTSVASESLEYHSPPFSPGETSPLDEERPSTPSRWVNSRRQAVYNARGNSVFNDSGSTSIERRLPGDGGPDAKRAHKDINVIAKACDGIAIFQGLHSEDRRQLFENMYMLEYSVGENIVTQGEDGRNFYVIVEGNPAVRVLGPKGEVVFEDKLSPGNTFGEVSLLHSCPRRATVSAELERVKVWALDRNTFKQLLSGAAFQRREHFSELVKGNRLFQSLSSYRSLQLADAFLPMFFNVDDVIIQQGSMEASRFHLIDNGRVDVYIQGEQSEVNTLVAGDFFGEVALIQDIPPTATVTAVTEVDTVSLDRANFRRLLGGKAILSSFYLNMRTYVFDKQEAVPASPGRARQRSLSRARSLSQGFKAMQDLALCESLSGSSGNLSSPMSSPDMARSPLSPAASSPDFLKLKCGEPPGSPFSSFSSSPGSPAFFAPEHHSAEMEPPRPHFKNLKRSDIVFLKELGIGMSGIVYLCKLPNHQNQLVVIKMMRKSKLLRLNQVQNVIREKDILMEYQDPFIIPCWGHFQDNCNLYLLMEYMAGGELFNLLVEKRRFPLPMARFYGAEVLLALEFIHSQGHVYRDLKPENILIADNGHIKLADMGFCKPLARSEKTYTTCGTADYMAPEVMLCQGHDRSADIWAFGVFLFEMLAGYAPFEGKTDTDRYHRILTGLIKFPDDFNLQAKDLVSKLCSVDLTKRLGMYGNGYDDIKQHPFFADLDWFQTENCLTKPPYLPKLASMSSLGKSSLKIATEAEMDQLPKDVNAQFAGY